MPVLTVGGTASFGADLEGEIGPLAKHMRSVMIENCGHYLAEEQPERVAEELYAFFAKAPELRQLFHCSRVGAHTCNKQRLSRDCDHRHPKTVQPRHRAREGTARSCLSEAKIGNDHMRELLREDLLTMIVCVQQWLRTSKGACNPALSN